MRGRRTEHVRRGWQRSAAARSTVALAAAALMMTALSPGAAAGRDIACRVGPTHTDCPGALETAWTGQVNSVSPRPEYPRPNLARADWQSLNGRWQFAFDDGDQGPKRGWSSGRRNLPSRIVVPWTFEAPLSGIGAGDPGIVHERVWYRDAFTVPAAWSGRRVRLNFGAVDWRATVWVNGRSVGTHMGGYSPFSFDITPALKPRGKQIVVVEAWDPVRATRGAYGPRGKQRRTTTPAHRWYTRTTGIWQSVWLEPVAKTHVSDLQLQPDPATAALGVDATVPNGLGARVNVTVRLGGRVVGTGTGGVRDGAARLSVPVTRMQRWTPERPVLYRVDVDVLAGGARVDRVHSYTAFRTISVQGDRIALNGAPYVLRGALDQGYWPDGVYTAPSDAALRADIEAAKSFGLNTLRMHVKVEDPRFYYWADRLGLLVVQDMPSSFDLSTPEAQAEFEREWGDMIRSLRDRPSVAFFVGFNENWGEPPGWFQDRIVAIARRLDSTRPVEDASNSVLRPPGDIIDVHAYGQRPSQQLDPNATEPQWVGEFGGLEVPIPGHLWTTVPDSGATPADLVQQYQALTDDLSTVPDLSGYSYTQLYDVEREVNGLETYDRVPKVPPEQIAAINRAALAK